MIALEVPRKDAPRAWSPSDKLLGAIILVLGYVSIELVGGSGPVFAMLMGAYVAVTLFAIRCNGGLGAVLGLAIFWQSFQTVLVSQVARFALGKNPETRFDAAIPTILCEILVTLGYALAGLVASRISVNRDRPLFPPISDLRPLKLLAIAGTALAVIRIIASGLFREGSGPLHMLTFYDPIAIGAAIGYTILQSKGRSMFSPLVLYVVGPIVFFSVLSGSRGGLFQSASAVVLSALMFGYRFRAHHYAMGIAGFLLMVFVISPYSLIARSTNRTGADMMTNINNSIDLMTKVVSDPIAAQFVGDQKIDPIFTKQDYYELPAGNAGNLLNRFGLVRVQDMIIADVLKNGTTGLANVTPSVDYLLPAALSPNKGFQIWATGNSLAHRIKGLVNEEDHTTGIVLGIPPDAFGAYGWIGALGLPFVGMLFYILVLKLLVSLDMRKNVFGIVVGLFVAIQISEGTLSTFVQGPIYFGMILFVAFYTVTWAAKLLDFRYLRPKDASAPLAEGGSGVVL